MSIESIFASPELVDAFIAGAAFVVMIQILVGFTDLLFCFIKNRFIKSR